ncbi:hypothetical protein OAT67_09825, partial [Bacteriovoracaceae bacterium]|nr:hypothetical protein [Bacteriovoracaceae bacterium]
MAFKPKADGWFKPKSYLHFDTPLKDSDEKRILKFVTDPDKVSKHSFYPFITYEVTKYKMFSDETSGLRYLDDSNFRPLSYAAHLDSQIYSYYAKILSDFYEKKLLTNGISENVLAFRKLENDKGEPKCNIHLANDAFEKIKEIKNCKVYAFDMKSFFDNLNHDCLKKSWCDLLD